MPKSIHPSEIPGIAAEAVELLEAAGFDKVELLSGQDPAVLHQEILQANATLQLAGEDVAYEEVARWLQEVARMTGQETGEACESSAEPEYQQQEVAIEESAEPEHERPMAVNYEQSPEVQAMLAGSPFALPLPARVLMQHQVSVSQIPAGIMLNHYVGDLEVRVNQSAPPPVDSSAYRSQVVGQSAGHGLDVSRVRTAQEAQTASRSPAMVIDENNHQSLIRAPRESTNRGRNPNSRWYIRGVLHDRPVPLYLGALATILCMVLVPASVVSAVLLILSSEMPERFSWVSPQLLWVPAALGLAGLTYLFCGAGGRCRVCNQKLFVYRAHLKNARAHRLPGMGYVLPLCLHLLTFRWFRCTHCGTPIRLKE